MVAYHSPKSSTTIAGFRKSCGECPDIVTNVFRLYCSHKSNFVPCHKRACKKGGLCLHKCFDNGIDYVCTARFLVAESILIIQKKRAGRLRFELHLMQFQSEGAKRKES